VTPAFSIFIPVWNDAAWLGGAVESVLAQTYPHWELIVGDNASTDDLERLVAAYLDPRIHYHRWPTHVDTYSNFNRTALLCHTDWLQLLSADDRLHPDCLARMAKRIEQVEGSGRRLAVVVTRCRRVSPSGEPAERAYYGSQQVKHGRDGLYSARGWLRLLAAPGMPAWNIGSVAVAREVVAEMGGFFRPDVGLCSDHELTLRAAAYGDVAYIDEPLLDYTVRDGSDGNLRFFQNRARGEAATPIGAALLAGLGTHESRRAVSPAERRMVHAAVARSHLQRAGQHRILPGGRGRLGALVDVVRAAGQSPSTVFAPPQLLMAGAVVLAPDAAIRWGSAALARRRGAAAERDAPSGAPEPSVPSRLEPAVTLPPGCETGAAAARFLRAGEGARR